MAFDARAIKQLKEGEYLTSADMPGLRVVARSSKTSWIYRFRSPVDEQLRQMTLGAWPAMSIAAAIVAWEKARSDRAAGIDPVLQAKQQREIKKAEVEAKRQERLHGSYTVKKCALDYWNEMIEPNRKPKGAKELLRMFETMLGPTGEVAASDLTRAQAFDLIMRHGKDKPVVAGYLRTALAGAWDHALDAGRLPPDCPNWWRLVLRGKLKSRGKKIGGESVGTSKRFLSAAETGELINWLPNFSQLIEDVLVMYLWTCTRGAEILTMLGSEVTQEAGGVWWWTIPKEKTKNARYANATDQRVPLFGRALAVVQRRRDRYGDDYLFPAVTKSGQVVATEQKSIQSTVWMHQPYSTTRPEYNRPRLTVTHWAPHDLRRTSRTLLAALGCPGEIAESILGHMLPGVQGVYNRHTYDAERAVWLKRLAEHLETLAATSAAS